MPSPASAATRVAATMSRALPRRDGNGTTRQRTRAGLYRLAAGFQWVHPVPDAGPYRRALTLAHISAPKYRRAVSDQRIAVCIGRGNFGGHWVFQFGARVGP